MADIDTTYLDEDTDSIKAARPALLEVVQRVNALATPDGTSQLGWIRNAIGAVARLLSDKVTESKISVKDFGVAPGLVADQTAKAQAAIDHCVLIGASELFWPMSAGEVYRIDGSLDAKTIAFIGDAGPKKRAATAYTFVEANLKACIYLRGALSQIIDLTYADGLSVVCNRPVHNTNAIVHTLRRAWHSERFGVYHAGLDNILFPFGCIGAYFGPATVSDRARRKNTYIGDLPDGTGAPDTDSNIIIVDGARFGYGAKGNFHFKGTGGIFAFKNGFDITKAGEPDDINPADMTAYGIDIEITGGVTSTSFTFSDGWLEKNANLFKITGTIKNIEARNLRIASYTDNVGVMFDLNGYIYNLNADQIGSSGGRYAYLFDAAGFSFDATTANNGITFSQSVSGYVAPCSTAIANNIKLLRNIGGFYLQSYPAGTITATGASGADWYYTVNAANVPSGSASIPITLQSAWFFNLGQASDVSLIVGGKYAGEIQTSSATTWTCNKSVVIGDGSAGLYVRQKIQSENTLPKSYRQASTIVM